MTTLLLDADFLMYRARYTFGSLSHEDIPTGATYGFLRELIFLMERFHTNKIIFCWDSPHRLRQKQYPAYKANRIRHQSAAEQEAHQRFVIERIRVQQYYLPQLGFHNSFIQDGYEADDLLARIAQQQEQRHYKSIIITADQDLYQCIGPYTYWLNPKKQEQPLGLGAFQRRYGISPRQWVDVKAIGGCTTDNIRGVRGVGEKTALKYCRNELDPDSAVYQRILSQWDQIVVPNYALVRLPLRGTVLPVGRPDEPSQEKWDRVTRKLGMKSIRFRNILQGDEDE